MSSVCGRGLRCPAPDRAKGHEPIWLGQAVGQTTSSSPNVPTGSGTVTVLVAAQPGDRDGRERVHSEDQPPALPFICFHSPQSPKGRKQVLVTWGTQATGLVRFPDAHMYYPLQSVLLSG